MDRFYHPGSLHEERVELTDGEAQHLARTLRKQPGDRVELFDGAGQRVIAEIVAVSKKNVELRIVERPNANPRAIPCLAIFAPLPKGERSRWLVEKASELGVDEFTPLLTQRSVVDPRDSKLDKLRQTVIAACKQCRRDWLMQVHSSVSWSECLKQITNDDLLLIADPSAETSLAKHPGLQLSAPPRIVLLFGPEGGLTDDETSEAIARGGQRVSLSSHVLRIETAVLAATSIVRSAAK